MHACGMMLAHICPPNGRAFYQKPFFRTHRRRRGGFFRAAPEFLLLPSEAGIPLRLTFSGTFAPRAT